ncbi:MAG: hypothetical protein JSS79_19075 [Bacteroidetes bacterium]|nr:hypothetical protein [Bacteroidota bacterium]
MAKNPEQVELSEVDVKKLNSSIRNTIVFALIAAIVVTAGFYYLSESNTRVFVPLTFDGFLLFISYYSISNLKTILKENKKTIIQGTITSERRERVGSGKSGRTNYYKTIGDHELRVDARINRKYQVGDQVEFEYATSGMGPYFFLDKRL